VSRAPTLWDRVDEPVLRWVASLPPTLAPDRSLLELEIRDPEPFEPNPNLNSAEVHESLKRLVSHGLVDGKATDFMQSTTWSRLRVTAFGLIVLGEWPDLDRVATAAALHRLLRALADNAPEEDRSALRRAAGVIGRTGDEIVRGTAADIAGTLGREAADG
jgi:hypothetical protein